MADLPTIADRITDLEVNANKPVTTTVLQRFGSNINFLLNFLGVADGSTAPSGSLNDLAQAVELITAHSMNEEVVIPAATGLYAVGTYQQIKYVNQNFYLFLEYTGGLGGLGLSALSLELSNNGTSSFGLYNVDGAPNRYFNRQTTQDYYTDDVYNTKQFSIGAGLGDFPTIVRRPPNILGPEKTLHGFFTLDWRDPGTDFNIFFNNNIFSDADWKISIIKEYSLDIKSLGF